MYCLLRLAINSSRLHGKGIRSEATVGISNCMTDLLGGGGGSFPDHTHQATLPVVYALEPASSPVSPSSTQIIQHHMTFDPLSGGSKVIQCVEGEHGDKLKQKLFMTFFAISSMNRTKFTQPGNRYMIYVTYVHNSVSHTQDHYCITHRNMYSVYVQWGPGDRQELGVCIPTTWHGMCGRVLVNEVSNF